MYLFVFLVLGLTQTIFEGSMYLFVFIWFPTLQESSLNPSSLPLGYIFFGFYGVNDARIADLHVHHCTLVPSGTYIDPAKTHAFLLRLLSAPSRKFNTDATRAVVSSGLCSICCYILCVCQRWERENRTRRTPQILGVLSVRGLCRDVLPGARHASWFADFERASCHAIGFIPRTTQRICCRIFADGSVFCP